MMSANAPIKQETDKPALPAGQSESEFLAEQARQAKAAIATVWSEFKHGVLSKADPVRLAQNHPKSAIGTAAAAGLVTAWVITPSRKERAYKKRSKMGRTQFSKDGNTDSDPNSSSFFNGMGAEILKILRPAILSILSAILSTRAPTPDENSLKSTDTPTNAS